MAQPEGPLCPSCGHSRRKHDPFGCTSLGGDCRCERTTEGVPSTQRRAPGVEMSMEPHRRSVEELLEAAAKLDHPRLVKQAEKVGQSVEVLREMVEGHQQRVEAEGRVARLRAELAAAETLLRGSPARPKAATNGGVPSAVVRAWAAENGLECGPTGRIAAHVMEAYRAANGGGHG